MTTFATVEINKYDRTIAEVEAQIQQLQETLTQCQSERQNIQSIEQMGLSAIAQIQKTLASCIHAGLPQLADSFKEQVTASLNMDNLPELPASDASTETEVPVIVPPVSSNESDESDRVTDDNILQTITALDEEHLTDNYLPIYLYRQAFPQLSREQQDNALYRLCANDRIELSTLQEVRSYTPEQIKAGIPQNIGGPLFFIVVEDQKERSPSKPIATASVGAASATDVTLMSFEELKTYCLSLGMNKSDIRKHGKLTRRDTWIGALKDFS